MTFWWMTFAKQCIYEYRNHSGVNLNEGLYSYILKSSALNKSFENASYAKNTLQELMDALVLSFFATVYISSYN